MCLKAFIIDEILDQESNRCFEIIFFELKITPF